MRPVRCVVPRAGLAAVVAATGVLAAASPALGAAVALEPATVAPGGAASLRGAGFAPRARVAVFADGRRIRTARAGRTGAFVVAFRAPGGRRRAVAILSRAGRVRVENRLALGSVRAGAQVATSRGARVSLPLASSPAGLTVPVVATGLRGRSARVRIGTGRTLTLRGDRAGRASGRVAVPARAGRSRLTVRVDGTTSRVDFAVAPSAPRLVAAGDIACAPGFTRTATTCHHAETAALVQSLTPDAVAALGDLQYENGTLAEFRSVFDPTWGAAAGSRLRPVPGNHEYQADPAASGYFDYLGDRAGDRTKGYYAYDLGTWRLVALNTNDNCTHVPCGAGSAQEQFLRAELAASAGRCTAVYWHHPRFSSTRLIGSNGAMSALWNAAHDLGADVVLTGHAHNYERLARLDRGGAPSAAGLRQFVAGSGGDDLHGFDPGNLKTGSEVRIGDAFGVLELTLRPSGYDWRFVVEGGAARDSGTDTCRQ